MTTHSATIALPLTDTTTAVRPRLARRAVRAARIALGLVFVLGLNGFVLFIPVPTEPLPEAATAFTGGLYAAGSFFPLLAGTQVVSGALLLSNRLVPLALTVLAPVVLEVGLAWAHRDAFRGVLAWSR